MKKTYKVHLSYGYAGCPDEEVEVTTDATGDELEDELREAVFEQSCVYWWYDE